MSGWQKQFPLDRCVTYNLWKRSFCKLVLSLELNPTCMKWVLHLFPSKNHTAQYLCHIIYIGRNELISGQLTLHITNLLDSVFFALHAYSIKYMTKKYCSFACLCHLRCRIPLPASKFASYFRNYISYFFKILHNFQNFPIFGKKIPKFPKPKRGRHWHQRSRRLLHSPSQIFYFLSRISKTRVI